MKHILIVLSFLFIDTYGQAGLFKIDLSQKINSSDLIIEGQVISQYCIKAGKGKISTISSVALSAVLKGEAQQVIEIITEGGSAGNELMKASNLLELKIGDQGLFFCITSKIKSGLYEVYSSRQGFYKYKDLNSNASAALDTYNTGSELLSRISNETGIAEKRFRDLKLPTISRAVPVITGLSPQTITAGTNSRLTITGSGFGNSKGSGYVEFSDADKGGNNNFIEPEAVQYVSWTDTEIVVEVPSEAGTGKVRVSNGGIAVASTTSITIPYARTQIVYEAKVYSPLLVDQVAGGYPWRMFSGFEKDSLPRESFTRAFTRWRCTSGVNWFLGSETDIDRSERDNVTIIRFDSGEELPAGVLGTCYSYYQACTEGQWYVVEFDIVFDDDANWEFGPELPSAGEYDFESVAFHELGHGHQLGHVINPADVMHYSIADASYQREPNQDDINGAKFVMDQSTKSLCNFGAMKPITADICNDPTFAYFKSEPPRIFPVPVNDIMHISLFLSEDQEVIIDLIDATGKIVARVAEGSQKKGEHTISLDLTALPVKSGTYILRSKFNNTEYNSRIVVTL